MKALQFDFGQIGKYRGDGLHISSPHELRESMSVRKIGLLNLLLVFVPISLGLHWGGASSLWVFAMSGVAIIPLAGLMGKSTEVLAERLGPGIGGLLNASFGNAAELIIALFALRAGLIDVVKASITGSVLGNVLLVLGASLFAGGLRFESQRFNRTAAGMAATLLALSAIGLLIPAIFHAHLVLYNQQDTALEQDLSLEMSLVLFTVYLLMLLFSLKTHKHLYDVAAEDVEAPEAHFSGIGQPWSTKVAFTVLLVATGFVALMSELLVGAIEETSAELGWTHLFVGVIVVAIVGNAAEHSTAVLMALKNQMDLSLQIAIGSGLQVALFVAPLLVFVSYLPGLPQLDLVFGLLEVVAVAVSVFVVGLVAYDGESNWLEGLLLLAVYVILAIAFFHLPEQTLHLPAAADKALPSITN